MERLLQSDKWVAARQEKMAAVEALPPSKALLGILRIINREEGGAVEASLLKGIVHLAHLQDSDCRLLASLKFPDNHPSYSSELHLGFAERMAYLQQMDYVTFASGFRLTKLGKQALDNYIEENGVMPIQRHETETVLEMVPTIRDALRLD